MISGFYKKIVLNSLNLKCSISNIYPAIETNSHPAAEKVKIFYNKSIKSLNDETNYHAVSVIKKTNTFRHFICGYFTLVGQKNPFIKNKTKMKTEFNF